MYVLLFGVIWKASTPGLGYRAGMILISILLCLSYCQRHKWAQWALGGWLALHVVVLVMAGIRSGSLNPWLFAFSFTFLIHLAVFSTDARSHFRNLP